MTAKGSTRIPPVNVYTIEWSRSARGSVDIVASTKEEAYNQFWEEYINGPLGLPVPDQDDITSDILLQRG